ncbi:MAG TPA: glycoside hydrolase family 15 protein [Steroidobacteraceae bacterium]|nr:glycoside hydrolase family 15 protein [Steroidobacteraceae bacterium]
MTARRIEDYAAIGDGETIALVSRDGSVDWLCWPRFDSGACFAALLGTEDHGHWSLAPAGSSKVTRRYREDTLILETTFTTDAGEVLITDFMPQRRNNSELIRIVRGVRGAVPMRMDLTVRFDYGSSLPWVTQRRADGGGDDNELTAIAGPDRVILRTRAPLRGEADHTLSDFTVSAGEEVAFVMTYSASHLPPPERIDVAEALRGTDTWWREWGATCRFDGPWREAVVRSLITLKALIYQPTGGIVAAATTSLPEELGGERNWDYRFCWLRDATFTLLALMDAGYIEEAGRWRDWLVRALAGAPSQAQIMYGLAGERRLTEWEVDWLPGFADSKPVRIGNEAYLQRQIDIYGEIADAMHHARRGGLATADAAWAVQRALTEHVEEIWTQEDEGIWEVRGPRRHFTHSKVMAWVAVDRAVTAAECYGLQGPVDRWRELRAKIHADVCARGYNHKLKSFTQSYGSTALDASLLMMSLVGFLPPDDPRVRGTVDAIGRELMEDGFILRYRTHRTDDGLRGSEGAFLACSFWYADNLALIGRRTEAEEMFERLLACRNDVGLLAEEWDPRAQRQLGNFPQAFSHVALVSTAYNLERRETAKPAEQRASGKAE